MILCSGDSSLLKAMLYQLGTIAKITTKDRSLKVSFIDCIVTLTSGVISFLVYASLIHPLSLAAGPPRGQSLGS